MERGRYPRQMERAPGSIPRDSLRIMSAPCNYLAVPSSSDVCRWVAHKVVPRCVGERMTKKQELLDRIAVDPRIMVGQPCIRGTRLTVHHILNILAFGASIDDVLAEYPGLTREDVAACLLFASEMLVNTKFAPLTTSSI